MHARNSVLPDPRFVLLTIVVAGCRGDPDPLAPVALPAAAAVGSTSALTGHIAFVTDRDGNFEIYSMNPDGSSQTNLTNDPRADFQPAWSTDGSQVGFSRVEDDGSQHVWVMNADGTGQHQVGTANGGEPSFSPDGTRIAFTSFTTIFTDFEIHVMNTDGTGDVAITSGGSDSQASWSPDGAWILFASSREKVQGGFRHTSLYLVRPDGSDLNRLTTMSGIEFVGRWSPDGTRIVFAHKNAQEIWIMNRDGTGLQRVNHSQSYQSLGGFSPDGLYIVFDSGHRSYKLPGVIYVMDADGGNVVQLTTSPSYNGNSAWGR